MLLGTVGLHGYVRAKSIPSVVAGEAGFVLMTLAGALMLRGGYAGDVGRWGGLAVAGLFAIFFAARFLFTKKFYPACLMMICSLAVCGVLLAPWFQRA